MNSDANFKTIVAVCIAIVISLYGEGNAQTAKDAADSPIAKAKVSDNAELYQSIATHEITEGNTVYPEGFPMGKVISSLNKGEMLDVLKAFSNDSESRYTLKVRTSQGKTGYLSAREVEITESYGDRGSIVSLHLSAPYEYEGDVESVNADIAKYKGFIEKFPNSQFVPEALVNMADLNIYTLQDAIPANDKLKRIEEIRNICKRLTAFNNAAWRLKADQLSEFLTKRQKDFSGSKVDFTKFSELQDIQRALMKAVPSSLNSVKEEK